MYEFSQELLVHLHRPPTTLAWIPVAWDGPFLSQEEVILENKPALLDPSSLQDDIPWDSSKQVPEQAKVCSPEVWGYKPAICLVSLRILNSTILWSLQPRLPPGFIFLTSSSLFKSTMSSRACLLVSSSITCGWKLSSLHLRRLLDCLCPAVLAFQQTLG